MKYKLVAAVALLPILVACGGGGSDSSTQVPDDIDRGGGSTGGGTTTTPTTTLNEDRTRPAAGLYSTATAPIKDNGANPYPNEGPQAVNMGRVASWPGLRFGDFLLTNNPWNASAATYENWYQDISLNPSGSNIQAVIDWDWGASADTNGSLFNTKSYPEVIYGTKSLGERSGDFSATGLPVEHYDSPVWTIDYGYTTQGRRSTSNSGGGSDSEYNVAIESFYHESCDIKRTGADTDNQIMEVMVWLKLDQNKPSGEAPHPVPFTTSDGRVYDVYSKNSNFNYIAYVAREEQTSGTVMYTELLNDAFDNAATYGVYQLKDTDCLANILMGTEIWHGAGTFTLSDYQINRTY